MMEASRGLDTVEIMPELHQSVVEVASGVCTDIHAARADVIKNRRIVAALAGKVNMRIAAASTHPFSSWRDQDISVGERYDKLVGELQDVARANVIFGLHVHVGIEDRDEAIAIYNSARYFLPHIMALSCSSPFSDRRRTGLMSSRSMIFKRLPRTGIPDAFKSYKEYEALIDLLVKTGCIDSQRRVWWDLRPHPIYSTLEYRVCDLPTRVDEVIAIAALIQALTARLMQMHRDNQQWRSYPSALIEENKWRAVRYGLDGKLIDFGRQKEVPIKVLIRELLQFVEPVVDYLGSRAELEYIHTMLDVGTSADRQIAVYDGAIRQGATEQEALEAVVDLLLSETMEGVAAPETE